jgi:hypothetical protein
MPIDSEITKRLAIMEIKTNIELSWRVDGLAVYEIGS